jgi:hypothetical protein
MGSARPEPGRHFPRSPAYDKLIIARSRQRRRVIIVDPEVIIVPIVFGLPTMAFMLRMLFKHKEKMASLQAPQDQSTIDARLQRVEQAMDAVAVEIERIGESQRFLTKVLTDKSLPGAPDQRQS